MRVEILKTESTSSMRGPAAMPQTCVFLPKEKTSGSTPKCSNAHHLPVMPKPVWTSSKMSRNSCSSASSRSARQELGAEVVVAALALDRLDDERGDVVPVLSPPRPRSRRPPGARAPSSSSRPSGVDREAQLRIDDPRPVELGEVLGLARIGGVGQRQRVAAAAVEGLAEVDDLRAHLAPARRRGSCAPSSRRRP